MVTLFMIIALEGIITFAHSLRLHWVEWFSKFYKGDGTPFEGFMIRRKFTFAGKV
jgi:vacuolar-type H+-ATPase subunit I/STV1